MDEWCVDRPGGIKVAIPRRTTMHVQMIVRWMGAKQNKGVFGRDWPLCVHDQYSRLITPRGCLGLFDKRSLNLFRWGNRDIMHEKYKRVTDLTSGGNRLDRTRAADFFICLLNEGVSIRERGGNARHTIRETLNVEYPPRLPHPHLSCVRVLRGWKIP